ncbi:U32 family peptidase [Collinsella intestinalis]|uniref:U32 family peptidase n=1 Tax=Collinsella intestinalis TaxID=147207 RepID=A0A414FYF6_9ACTN|nr:U32 family peptidase [Collinsella intestinalis]RHD56643.1 U32 family peptidase [Collinsella intestinalis]
MPSSPSTRFSKPELLAPAGGPEPFYAALAAGADAIYCGMGSFNARRKADNFTDESFEAACRAAHLAGSRVYVTVNIVIKDEEMSEALSLVDRCWRLGSDAFIIQDWGLFFEIRRLMPEVETHISTQANIHDARGTAWCKEAGADRVTLSRELSIDEVAIIHDAVDIELEVFSHGAICFCYSGVCLLSSFTSRGRSANRGMCAQPCRLPYELIDETGRSWSKPGRERALCPRDTCTADKLPRLLDAGAHALKLEGRMKAPDYVHSIVSAYRAQLDDILAGREISDETAQARYRQLKRCFNRDFTSEYQEGRSGDEMMSYERSNNRGQIVGEVLGSKPLGNTKGLKPDDKRRRAAWTKLRLSEPVGKGDLLELRHNDEFDQFLTAIAPEDAQAGDSIECRTARPMPAGALVRLIRSQAALDAAEAALKRPVARKRAVDVRVVAHLGQPFTVELTCIDDPALSGRAEGFTVESAKTRAVSAEDLVEHVGRMGSSPFEAVSFDIQLDEGCGMGFSAVHKVRAAACKALERAILAPYAERVNHLMVQSDPVCPADLNDLGEVCALVTSLNAAAAARKAGAARVYMTVDDLLAEGLSPASCSAEGVIPVLDEVSREADHERLDPWFTPGAPAAVGTISELALGAEIGSVVELRSCIPVHNVPCMRELAARGAHAAWLSPELTLAEIERIAPQRGEMTLGLMVLGTPRVMTSEHCILQVAGACIHDCANCRLRARDFKLKNIDGRMLPVRTALNGRSHLYDGVQLDATPQIPQLLRAGVTRFLVDGTLMNIDMLSRSVARTNRALEAARSGRTPDKRLPGTSSGCLFQGVE